MAWRWSRPGTRIQGPLGAVEHVALVHVDYRVRVRDQLVVALPPYFAEEIVVRPHLPKVVQSCTIGRFSDFVLLTINYDHQLLRIRRHSDIPLGELLFGGSQFPSRVAHYSQTGVIMTLSNSVIGWTDAGVGLFGVGR